MQQRIRALVHHPLSTWLDLYLRLYLGRSRSLSLYLPLSLAHIVSFVCTLDNNGECAQTHSHLTHAERGDGDGGCCRSDVTIDVARRIRRSYKRCKRYFYSGISCNRNILLYLTINLFHATR